MRRAQWVRGVKAIEATDLNTEPRRARRYTESILVDGVSGPPLGARTARAADRNAAGCQWRTYSRSQNVPSVYLRELRGTVLKSVASLGSVCSQTGTWLLIKALSPTTPEARRG